MVTSKTPLRISFVGGMTDVAWFYQKHGGAVISTAIDKFITVTVGARERGGEEASKNPIVRACLQKVGIDGGVSIEIESDVPAGTGLGSSSALTVGLLNALIAYKSKMTPYKEFLAEAACEIEINVLGNPIGKQDQYAGTYGGMRHYKFHKDGSVDLSDWRGGSWNALEDQLMLFRTRVERGADTATTTALFSNHDEDKLKEIKALVPRFDYAWFHDDVSRVGGLLHENWRLKSQLNDSISNGPLDKIYQLALDAGALGGKLLGAGGGGHFLFYVRPEHQETVKAALDGLAVHVEFKFEAQGTRLI